MMFQVGDIFVYQSNKTSSKNISTIVGYGYKQHLRCFAYDIQQNYISEEGSSHISNYETDPLSLKIMVERDGYTHYPVVK